MPLLSDPPPMGSGGSPNQASIIFNVEEIIKRGVNANHLADLFDNIKTIEGQWDFSTNPKFGTNTGFLYSTTGVLSFVSLATVATSGAYSDLSGKPTIPATINDLGSPTSAFNFGNQDLKNVSGLVIGSNTSSGYNSAIRNAQPITNFLGTSKGHISLENGYTYAGNEDKYLSIDFQPQLNWDKPTARIACQNTDAGSFIVIGTSNVFADGITHMPAKIGYFYTEATSGIKLEQSLLFTTNNTGTIGTSSVAVANIYAVNALNITSDKRDKIINEKLNLKKDFSFEFLEKMVKTCIISWKWNPTVIPEQKVNSFEKIKRKNKETGDDEIDYILTTKIIEPEKIINHNRNHIGLNLNELFKLMVEFNMSTKDYAFLSINDTYELKSFDEQGNEIIETKNSFDENGEPVLDELGYPLGKLTYKPQELQSLLFIYSFELYKRDLEKNKKIDDLETRLSDLEKQIKILLKK